MSQKRTSEEMEEDFLYTHKARKQGKTWSQITDEINQLREYEITSQGLKMSYDRQIRKANVRLTASAELERMLDEIQWTKKEAINAWYNSLKDKRKVKKEYIIKQGIKLKQSEIEDLESSGGDPRFLKLFLDALKQEADLLEIGRGEQNIDFNVFIQNNEIHDESGTKAQPIQDENQVHDIDFEEIIQNLDV